MHGHDDPLSIAVIGASGDLARKKLFPALFALFCRGLLPERLNLFGLARTDFGGDDAFRDALAGRLTCRRPGDATCPERVRAFLARCRYVRGEYGDRNAYLDLYERMRAAEGGAPANRVYDLAVPPSVFLPTARALGAAGLVSCGSGAPWSRVVIEKPFGRDRASSDALTREMAAVFSEDQTFRIDHYLGKEVIQNLLVLRFANLVFEPIWNARHVRSVEIVWQEDSGVEGRGGYFDGYGIIRDVVQNHLLQMVALTAMEPPAGVGARAVREAKVAVLRAIPPPTREDVVLGQYGPGRAEGGAVPGYTDDPSVPRDSRTPTFVAVALRVCNPRWEGVPFLLRAGKGLDSRFTEIRVRFRPVPVNPFCGPGGCPPANELVLRIQPDESVRLNIVSKIPGLGMKVGPQSLDLLYRTAFEQDIPDAYESLLLDVIKGDKSLFIRDDELAASWDVFTPVLHEFDRGNVQPEIYPFGGRGPAAAERLAERLAERSAAG